MSPRTSPRERALRPWGLPFACALLLLAGCGGGPSLAHLRCRRIDCQDPERPLVLLLAVDFSDGSGTLSRGTLDLKVGGQTGSTQSLADVFACKGKSSDCQPLGAQATQGTLWIDHDVHLDSISSGEQFTISLVAHDGNGQSSNEPSMTLRLGVTPDGGTP